MVLWEPKCSPQDVQQSEAGPRVGTALHLQHDRDLSQSRQSDAGYGSIKIQNLGTVKVGKNLHMVRLQLILFPKITGAFLFRTFGGFLHVPTTDLLPHWRHNLRDT